MIGGEHFLFIILLFLLSLIAVPLLIVILVIKLLNSPGSPLSEYSKTTGNNSFQTFFNKGTFGEYLTFNMLHRLDGEKRLLANVYLPKGDGTTTEIDLIMISQAGIFVFESKNFSGWIFGNESWKTWTQTLPRKHKYKFYNPIWQNKSHINALNNFFQGKYQGKFHSYIVFSERCTLKSITIHSRNVHVVKRNELLAEIRSQQFKPILSPSAVELIYSSLSQYCNVNKEIKQRHKIAVKEARIHGAE